MTNVTGNADFRERTRVPERRSSAATASAADAFPPPQPLKTKDQ